MINTGPSNGQNVTYAATDATNYHLLSYTARLYMSRLYLKRTLNDVTLEI
jgi:hypothetical protein